MTKSGTELTSLKGIGLKTAEALGRLGIKSAEELRDFYPRDYELFSEPKPFYELRPGEVAAVRGILHKSPTLNRYNGLTVVNAYLRDITGSIQLSWFNAPYIRNSLTVGRPLVFRGRVTEKNSRLILNQPKIFDAAIYDQEYVGRFMPLYHLTRGLNQKTVMNAVAEAIRALPPKEEFLPQEILDSYDLMPIAEASVRIHYPKDTKDLQRAAKRLIFDEFLLDILAGRLFAARIAKADNLHRCRPDLRIIKLMASLPFELTMAQTGAYKEIAHDMNSPHVMNRLVEGDVGSGKTIVALLAAVLAALNGFQAVFMAPTAVLASQHYETLQGLLKLLSDTDNTKAPKAVLLTGGLSQAERTGALRAISSHEADIIIGTHAVFQDKVEYDNLGLVITDEQHRFGVSQREAIFQKGEMPHMLIMSATPIPRTLSLILYHGMDVSVIDRLPEGRLPIKNAVIGPDDRNTAWRFIYSGIQKGAQAYIICPAIDRPADEDEGYAGAYEESTPLENVNEYSEKLKKIFPPSVRILTLHGRMKDEDKNAVMAAFKSGDADILVSTTVVEVGVDVPNASLMLIENAERFGLAELHQLRGRVGRGDRQSYCMFVNTSDSEKAAERLDILRSCNDGFRIAEEDLRLRGPGDKFGLRQSGETAFGIADIYRDRAELIAAGRAADEIMEKDPELSSAEHHDLSLMVREIMSAGQVL